MTAVPVPIRQPKMPRVEICDVSPAYARELLGLNTHNRKVRKRVVLAYSADMASGNWRWNGESIKISASNVLLDGQHRLMAVIEANVTVRMIIVFDLDEIVQETVDGGAKRKFSDVLTLRGEQNATILAAVARRIVQFENGVPYANGNYAPTNAQMIAAIERNRWVTDGISLARSAYKGANLPESLGLFLWWRFVQIDPEDAEGFFRKLASEEDHHSGEPIFALRRALAGTDKLRGQRNERFLSALTIKAWNKFRDGDTVELLRFRPGGANPEKFPEPK